MTAARDWMSEWRKESSDSPSVPVAEIAKSAKTGQKSPDFGSSGNFDSSGKWHRTKNRPDSSPPRAGTGTASRWAEGLAKLDPDAPVEGFPSDRWRDLIAAGRDFLDVWGDEAVRLGWRVEDVFGVHPIAPAARYDCAGLVLFLHDGAVVETISVDTATIRHRDGTRLSYRRRASRAGVMLLWELRP